MTDREWGEHLCQRLVAAIGREVPPEVWRWDRAQRMVEEAEGALDEEIRRLNRGHGDRQRAIRLGLEVLAAWRAAVQEWRRANVRVA